MITGVGRIEVVRIDRYGLECWCPDSYLKNGVVWELCPKHVIGELWVPRPEQVW